MKKYSLYITQPEQEFNVFGRKVFVEDGMICCADPAIAMPCKVGDVFVAILDSKQYHEPAFDIRMIHQPRNLNSFVAWLCGFNAERRCAAWKWQRNRGSFKAHAHQPAKESALDERVMEGKLYLAVVRHDNPELPATRLWAGIANKDVTADEVLSIADLIIRKASSTWIVMRLKDWGIEINVDDLRKARGIPTTRPMDSQKEG